MAPSDKTYSVPLYTTSNGCPVSNPNAMIKMGKVGPALIQDHHLIDLLAHFDRERIPERVAHAKGSGAHGYLEVTEDVSDIVSADFLNGIGKKRHSSLVSLLLVAKKEVLTPHVTQEDSPSNFTHKRESLTGLISTALSSSLEMVFSSLSLFTHRKLEILKLI